jgi:HEPN domain-containing protein
VTNGERADRLLAEAALVAEEMRRARQARAWNLTARRAQEVLELVVKGLLTQMGVEYPKTHDPAPLFVQMVAVKGLQGDDLGWLLALSARLEKIRGPAFYQEITVGETEAVEAAEGADRALAFGRGFLETLGRR